MALLGPLAGCFGLASKGLLRLTRRPVRVHHKNRFSIEDNY